MNTTTVHAFGRTGTVAAALLLSAPAAMAQITGSPHDLSGRGWGTDEKCIFCHTPHNANVSSPLWNHKLSSATYTLYSSATLNATLAQPAGISKLCLSCHDGTVAIDSYGSHPGANNMAGRRNLGINLGNDHPVSFTYDAALASADGGLVTPASASSVTTNVPLYASKVECATCHNVHSNAAGRFLRVANSGSALCLKCHTK